MRLICDTRNLIYSICSKVTLRKISDAGFAYVTMNAASFCSPTEFSDLKRKNYKREEDFYLTEEPERLGEVTASYVFDHAKDIGIQVPIAIAPFAAPDIMLGKDAQKASPEMIAIYRSLSKETKGIKKNQMKI